MGPRFAVFRAVAGVLTAIVGGIATNLFGDRRQQPDSAPAPTPTPIPWTPEQTAPLSDGRRAVTSAERVRRVFRHAFGEMLDEIAHWLVIGIVVAALITVLLPRIGADIAAQALEADGAQGLRSLETSRGGGAHVAVGEVQHHRRLHVVARHQVA